MQSKNFMETMIERAKNSLKRIAFPETSQPDILRTASQVVKRKIGIPVLIGPRTTIEELAKEHHISTNGFEYFDCTDEENRQRIAGRYVARYDQFSEKAVIRKGKDPARCAMFLLTLDLVDGVAAGKEYSTGDIIFEAMSIVGMKATLESVSSLGIADIPGYQGSQGSLLGIADCAIHVSPDSNELASIAISSADTVRSLLDWEPKVAMLAFSTSGSAEHESLEIIREAIQIVRKNRPDIKIDGEFQLDAAIIPEVAKKKVKWDSEVAGHANVLVFPNLHAGNIGVKMLQIFGKGNAYGPVLQGLAKPVCDFSRSAPVEEMLGNVAMLVIRSQMEER